MLQSSSRQLLNVTRRTSTRAVRAPLGLQSTRHTAFLAVARLSTSALLNSSSSASNTSRAPLQQQWIRSSSMRSSGPPVPPPKQADSHVSATSTTRGVTGELGDRDEGDEVDQARSGTEHKERHVPVNNALVSDLKTIKETFALREVPQEALVLGLAGLIPYVTTSLTTVFCAWDVNYAATHGAGFLITEETATQILQFLEPLQIGYGAVILSFLGAVHWGLEWAEFGGKQGYRRYAVGMAAPIIAWPTVFFPYEYALITQFLGFTYLYYADATATARGWTPQWYGTYRFVLTFIAGASIVISLIGRGEVGDVMERKQMGISTVANPGKALKVKGEQRSEHERDEYEAKRAKIYDQIEEAKKKEQKKEKPKKKDDEAEDEEGDAKEESGDEDSKDESKDESKAEGDDDKKESKDKK